MHLLPAGRGKALPTFLIPRALWEEGTRIADTPTASASLLHPSAINLAALLAALPAIASAAQRQLSAPVPRCVPATPQRVDSQSGGGPGNRRVCLHVPALYCTLAIPCALHLGVALASSIQGVYWTRGWMHGSSIAVGGCSAAAQSTAAQSTDVCPLAFLLCRPGTPPTPPPPCHRGPWPASSRASGTWLPGGRG